MSELGSVFLTIRMNDREAKTGSDLVDDTDRAGQRSDAAV